MIGAENLEIDFANIDEEKQEEVAEMLVRDTLVALVANSKSRESFCLIKITEKEN